MADYIPNEQDHELDWDDVITKDGSEFTILKEGKYPFRVKAWSRFQHNGSAKLPPCKGCELDIVVTDPATGDETYIKHRLYLHSRTEGLISQFFCSIGLKKHGEPLKMQWNMVSGSTGICKVYIEEWKGNDGQMRQSNKIKSFCDPEPTQSVMTPPPGQAPQLQAQSQQSFGGFGAWS